MIRIFVGFDERETVAYNVLAHSIAARSSDPVALCPIRLAHLKEVLTRERHPLQSSDFSFSRFLTPYLCDYHGWAIFMDCDMLVLDDIAKLWALRDEQYAVQVVKHQHRPVETTKFLGQPQSKYEKKNWSSVMLFNNARCTALTVDYVNQASGLELHQFKWLHNDELIGGLPSRWNHLVGYDKPRQDPAIVHYTIGGPYFKEYQDCEYAEQWFLEREAMAWCQQRGSERPPA